jgi:hypothetical protein
MGRMAQRHSEMLAEVKSLKDALNRTAESQHVTAHGHARHARQGCRVSNCRCYTMSYELSSIAVNCHLEVHSVRVTEHYAAGNYGVLTVSLIAI